MVRVLATLLIAIPIAASAAPGDERWYPYSRTAESITGPITLSPTRLSMARGVTLPLRVVADTPAFQTPDGVRAVRILAVTQPANPIVLNGNTLCSVAIQWIVVWREPSVGLGLAMYSSGSQPTGASTDTMCGTYFYQSSP